MSIMDTGRPTAEHYKDGRTKQAFKDETDINKILARAAKGNTISHLAKHGAMYGDFSDIDDLLTAHQRLAKGQEIFDALPGEVKREFGNNVGRFFNFVNDPANIERLPEILPGLAAPGNQMPAPRRNAQTVQKEESDSTPAPGDSSPPAGTTEPSATA